MERWIPSADPPGIDLATSDVYRNTSPDCQQCLISARFMKRIHIIGTGPRTGTTLMAEAMKSCCNIDCTTRHEDRLFARPTRECQVYMTKAPADLFVIWPTLLVDPDLYVICLVRDPRDAVVSRHGKDKLIYWGSLRYWKKFYPLLRKYEHHQRFVVVRYEDFVAEPDTTQDRLVKEIPFLEKIHDFSRYHEVTQPDERAQKALLGVRPIKPVGIGTWRNNLPRIKQQLALHGDISADLVALGYEPDDAWLRALEGVEPYDGGELLARVFLAERLDLSQEAQVRGARSPYR